MTVKQFDTDTETIIAAKQKRLQERQAKTPNAAVVALAEMQQRPRPVLNIATGGETIAVIAHITHDEIYDPVGLALRYARVGVDAISFFTDSQVYDNGLNDLLLVSRAVALPIISQDFILDGYHVAEARAAGASALTLYASLLDRVKLRQAVSLTQRWQMTAILQIEREDQFDLVREVSPHVVAVGTLSEYDTTSDVELLRRLRPYIPYNMHCMLLDRLATVEDVEAALALGVDALILDDRLLGQPDTVRAIYDRVHQAQADRRY